jgi:hypothetical protein
MKIKGGDKGFSHQPVWADADNWYTYIASSSQSDAIDVNKIAMGTASEAYYFLAYIIESMQCSSLRLTCRKIQVRTADG